MNDANILKIVIHLGTIVGAGKDCEKLIADLVGGKAAGPDAQVFLTDLSAILSLFPIPGLPADAIAAALAGIKAAV